jgi:acyl transferase domain-containing protein
MNNPSAPAISTGLEIAIIGLAGRFPGAQDIDTFWQNLCDGVESVSFFSEDELYASGLPSELINDPKYVKAGAILEHIDLFDAAFFGFSPGEAEILDPQQRLFLECAWEALEQAGYACEHQESGAVGVYAGASLNTYLLNNIQPNHELTKALGGFQIAIASDKDFLATRTSYKLNLEGPSITLQTACSTSLVAVHLACQGLLSGECDMALAGAVAVRVPHKVGYLYQEGGIASPDGHCRAFDAEAEGTTFGNGAGVVVLKRLADALRDGDSIWAVIKGSAVNNDGALKIGYTAPRVDGQAKAIRAAQIMAEVEPETISYIETHGTGTPLGDPIEIAALMQAFQAGTEKKRAGTIAIGSVKTNIGHLDTAAGIAGLIKTVLALRHKQLPPSLHFRSPNPQIDFANSPFYVNTTCTDWKSEAAPRRAGVSSFGIGGTNAHVILEEAPPVDHTASSRPWHLITLSAKTNAALDRLTGDLAAYLRRHADSNLADLAYTLQVGRKTFEHRRAVICQDVGGAIAALEGGCPARVIDGVQEQAERPVVFMFPGQGAQYLGMGQQLYATEPVFRQQVDRCAELLWPHLGLDIREVLYPQPTNDQRPTTNDQRQGDKGTRGQGDKEREQSAIYNLQSAIGESAILHPPSSILDQTQYAQPALFVIEYALARLWMAWGVKPQAMIGHSIGELVAAAIGGVFSLEDAIGLVVRRGQLMQSCPPGAMLAVLLAASDLSPLLAGQLALAAINAPGHCVVSGPPSAVEDLDRRLRERGIQTRRLHTSHAFHSAMMDSAIEPFIEAVGRMSLHAPHIPFISNVTGTWITPVEATDPRYWARHLRQTVHFGPGLGLLLQDRKRTLIEVGPGRTLSSLARQHDADLAGRVVTSLRHAQDTRCDWDVLLHAAAVLWTSGAALSRDRLYAGERRRRIPLPSYPFERQQFWIAPPQTSAEAPGGRPMRAERQAMDAWFTLPSWKRSMPPKPPRSTEQHSQGRCWLILHDPCGLGDVLAQRLTRMGQSVIDVRIGARFERIAQRSYTLDPERKEEYHLLIEDLVSAEVLPDDIVHLWSITPPSYAPNTAEDFDRIAIYGFHSLLLLVQALGKQRIADSLRLTIVSNGMQQVSGEEPIFPAKATMLGPCRVIPQEYPAIECRSIDITLPTLESSLLSRRADRVLAELELRSSDRTIAYRGHDRWVQSFEPAPLRKVTGRAARLRENGVYLITGGFGGLGLALATYLAHSIRAKLVLLGRVALPERTDWARWLETHGQDDAISRRIQHVQALEALGAEVLPLSADVTDQRQMRAALEQVRAQFGVIHGVIHAAGIAGGGVIQLKTAQSASQVLAPKVQGTMILAALLEHLDIEPDFFVLCSSMSSIVGGFGQVDYCAANAFLDAFARQNAFHGDTFITSIDWDRWQDTGMAATSSAALKHWEQQSPASARRAHPLLGDYLTLSGDKTIYLNRLRAHEHWTLAEHKVAGSSTMPGAAYPEMMWAAYKQRMAGSMLEIRQLVFTTPLTVRDDETKEVLALLEWSEDSCEFLYASRTASGGEVIWQEHAHGYIEKLDPLPDAYHNPLEIISRCDEADVSAIKQELEEQSDRKFVTRGPRWWTAKKLFVGADERLALLELAQENFADTEQFAIHPALLDVATGLARPLDEERYLPLAYDRIQVLKPLPAKIYSHIRYIGGFRAKEQLITCDITIMNEYGEVLLVIKEFMLKRLSDDAIIALGGASNHNFGGITATHRDFRQLEQLYVHARLESTEARPRALLPQEGVECFARILDQSMSPQIIVSTIDIQTTIEQANTFAQSQLLGSLEQPHAAMPAHPRPHVNSVYTAPTNDLERTIAAIWQRVLRIDQVGIHDNFFELGGDSLISIRLIAELKKELKVDIPTVGLFEAPTVAALASYVGAEQAAPASYQHSHDRAEKKKAVIGRQRQLMKERKR